MKIREGKYWDVECKCGNTSDRYFNTIFLNVNLVKDGWAIENDSAICPACLASRQNNNSGGKPIKELNQKSNYKA